MISFDSVTVHFGDQSITVKAKTPLPSNVFRVRKWGDPIMVEEGGFSTFNIGVSNFQAIGLYNKANNWTGGVSNFLRIPLADIARLRAMQLEDDFKDKKPEPGAWLRQKMNWLVNERGSMYFYFHHSDDYPADYLEWGTIAIGNAFVHVVDIETLTVPGTDKRIKGKRTRRMCKLAGFRRSDWDRPLNDLLASGLVHRCYCAYMGDDIGDTPKGKIYSPFWSPLDWQFIGPAQPQPDAFYIPEDWLIK
jgi:hypothetical protein